MRDFWNKLDILCQFFDFEAEGNGKGNGVGLIIPIIIIFMLLADFFGLQPIKDRIIPTGSLINFMGGSANH